MVAVDVASLAVQAGWLVQRVSADAAPVVQISQVAAVQLGLHQFQK